MAQRSNVKSNAAGSLTIVCGLQGVGKTTVARRIAERVHATLLRTDVIRKELQISQYSEEEKQKVYNEMFSKAKKLLQGNKNVVLDATFIRQKNREQAQQIAEQTSVNFQIVHVVSSEKTVKRRLEERVGDESEAGFQQYSNSKNSFEPIIGMHIAIDNSGAREETFEQLDKYF